MTHPGRLLKQNKLFAGKELGQNFLADSSTAEMIVEKTGISKTSMVLEIGPGLGALTIPLARAAAGVIAVEKDRRLIPLLEQELAEEGIDNVEILNRNFLKTDLLNMAEDKKLVVVGNLPYNISSQILFRLIEQRACIEKAFLMFQKELAMRIAAPPGSRSYSRLSAVAQYASVITCIAHIAPSCFFPRPEVESTILEFDFICDNSLSRDQEYLLFEVMKAAFSKRRKSLKNSMAGTEMKFEKPFVEMILENAGIDAKRRAETLNVDEFKSIAMAVWQARQKGLDNEYKNLD
jgi:16S rRNA (adenine1518-N6/adenine1519-N6)-dimethyltransferase